MASENEVIKHMSTTDVWEVEEGFVNPIIFTVRRHELWQEGEQKWEVFVEEQGVRKKVENPKYHEIVRRVQMHLLR